MRQTLRWLGHVCRMQIHRLPKLALFGTWIQNTSSPIRSHNHLIWIHTTLTEADIHPMDFFRLAQNTDITKWEQLIKRAFPQPRLTPAAARTLNHWRSGRPPPRPQSPTLSSNPEYVAYPGEQSARKCRASSNSRRYRHFNTTTDSPTPSRIPPSPPSPVTNAANAAKPSPHPMHGSIMNPEYYTLSQMQTTRTYSVGDPTLPPSSTHFPKHGNSTRMALSTPTSRKTLAGEWPSTVATTPPTPIASANCTPLSASTERINAF